MIKGGKVLLQLAPETLQQATGTADATLGRSLVDQAAAGSGALSGPKEEKIEKLEALLAQLAAIAPRDAVEGMLAAQLVMVHNLACAAFAEAQRSQDAGVADRHLNRGLKLIAAFSRGLDALDRRRGKGQQRIIVEHIEQAAIMVQGDPARK